MTVLAIRNLSNQTNLFRTEEGEQAGSGVNLFLVWSFLSRRGSRLGIIQRGWDRKPTYG